MSHHHPVLVASNADDEVFVRALQAFEGGPEVRSAFAETLRATPMLAVARVLFESDDPVTALCALGAVAGEYCYGADCETGSSLALAGYVLAKRMLGSGRGSLLPSTVTLFAAHYVTACSALGDWDQISSFVTEELGYLEQFGNDDNVSAVRVARISALVGSHEVDRANDYIARDRASIQGAARIEFYRLERLVAEQLEDVTRVRGSEPAITTMTSEQRALFESFDEILRAGETIFVRGGSSMNEWQSKARIRRAATVLADPARAGTLERALDELIQVQGFTRAHGPREDHHDALWIAYLCRSRLGSFSAAADTLQELARCLDLYRDGIADPLLRGGVTRRFPHLYPALCKMLALAKRTPELLDAMEAAKGRAAAELLERETDAAPISRQAASSFLPALMRRVNAHYLSFFVDDDQTYAVLVDKHGSFHLAEPIPLGKTQIRTAVSFADPSSWNKHENGELYAPIVRPASEELAPLVGWLLPLAKSGLLESGDHLCYCPDEHLHHLPLHYLSFGGTALVRRFSVSRVHGAALLARILERPGLRPMDFVSFEVPLAQHETDPAMIANFHWVADWLGTRLSGAAYGGRAATIAALVAAPLTGKLVHFATHGIFPAPHAPASDPFGHSGLLLAGTSGLPDANLPPGRQEDCLLSPRLILDERLDFNRSVVTAQACVSGLSAEGIAGDGLGLDWAFLQAGADTVLSTHWRISARLAAEFLKIYYQKWLVGGRSRARAWREACLTLMDQGGESSDAHCWAAFSVCGDWR